ncbi:nucleotide disphospho-sugar-binding domain-containing protein [Streptomyces sp. NPDC097619]|uniref:nucleotide disphospho-sugar-binding domain-containing protein n=1 Tax=Streptomyces sp. NPDC097619 TaxID=3157228 RepID=UPI003328A787
MRVLFVTNPFRAHLYVQVPLAWALRTAGHEVVVAGPPDLADAIARTGLPGIAVGDPLNLEAMLAAGPPPDDPTCDPRGTSTGRSVQEDYCWGDALTEIQDLTGGVRQVFFPERTFEDLIGFARQWRPDLVISDPTAFPGTVAAKVVGAAHARMTLNVDRTAQLRAALRERFAAGTPDPMRDWLEPILARHGVEFDESAVLGQWTVNPVPGWIGQTPGVHYLPMRAVPFNGPASTPRWVYEPPTRPRVVITQGISHRDASVSGVSSAVRNLFEAVEGLDAEVVATLDAKQLDGATVPDNVRTVDFVPFTSLLPGGCAAIVHEGGVGSFATALENAVPQVIVPNDFRSEKWWGPVAIGTGLEARGAGVYAANSSTLTPAVLHDGLKRILDDPSYAANAARLRSEVRAMPSPNELVPALERLTAEHRTARP